MVAAHPDDEVLGCGGLIPRLANEGQEVFIAILGEGLRRVNQNQRRPRPPISKHYKFRVIGRETLKAKEVFHYGLPDNRFDSLQLLEIIKIMEELIER